MNELQIVAVSEHKLPTFQISAGAIQLRDDALAGSALIGKVENGQQNEDAVRALTDLKRVSITFEQARKKLKEPILEAGRQLDRAVAAGIEEVQKEIGRLTNLTSQFQIAERRRMREEEEAQQRELERIERDRQAELRRIAEEQARAERIAREAREAAEREAREAKTKKEREAAQKAFAEAEAKRIEAEKIAALSAAKTQQVHDEADAQRMAESQPIQTTRAAGQVIKTDWEIDVINPYELAKFHPDCVRIEPLLTPIKAALNAGIAVKGIRAEKVINTNVRAKALPVIEV